MGTSFNQTGGPQNGFPWQFVAMVGSIGIGALIMLLMLLEII